MSDKDDEFDKLLRNYRMLTPTQRDLLTQRIIERAQADRAEAIRDVFRRLFGWFRRRAAVARLRALDDRMLKDIGIYRSEIEAAVRGPDRLRSELSQTQPSVTAFHETRPVTPCGTVRAPDRRVGRAA
jgi:uncharacterized protein YjiS (DUF1127 family)